MMRPSISADRVVRGCVVGVLVAHLGLLGVLCFRSSPHLAEVSHLTAGLSHLSLGRFDLYRVNPPLVRTVAAVPVMLQSPERDWHRYDSHPLARAEIPVGTDFVNANGKQVFRWVTLARWACIPFSLLGGLVCYRWASALYGNHAGLLALVLWCFCPFVLAHASMLLPDAHAAAIGAAAAYLFWRWLQRPGWYDALLAGFVLGFAELCKLTLLVFYPLWVLMWLAYRVPERRGMSAGRWCRETGQLATQLALSVLIINCGYGFEGSFQRLEQYRFQSEALSGFRFSLNLCAQGANRARGTWAGMLPVPVPRNYLQGIDTQKAEFELPVPSYLRGEWSGHGWWYYYIYVLAIKIPLGTLCLAAMALGLTLFGRRCSASWRDEMVVLLPAFTILALVSSQTGFTIHSRYITPSLPFLFIWAGKAGQLLQPCSREDLALSSGTSAKCGRSSQRRSVATLLTGAALAWSISSSLWCFPHSLAYCNELIGGPKNGHIYVLDSNVAWGQDLFHLKDWLQEHPQARPLRFASFGYLDPRLAHIDFTLPPIGPKSADGTTRADLGPQPGWYAIDVNHLHGTRYAIPDGQGGWAKPTTKQLDYSYFLRFEPAATAGYSIYIYNITLDEANRVRRELRLPELSESPPAEKYPRVTRRDASWN